MLRSSHDACGCSTQTTSTIILKSSTLHPHEGRADRPNTPSDSVNHGSGSPGYYFNRFATGVAPIDAGAGRTRVHSASRILGKSQQLGNQPFSPSVRKFSPVRSCPNVQPFRHHRSERGTPNMTSAAAPEGSASRRRSTFLGSRTIARPDEAAAASGAGKCFAPAALPTTQLPSFACQGGLGPSGSVKWIATRSPSSSSLASRIACGRGFRGGAYWTGILLNSSAVCSQEQDMSLRYLQNVGDIRVFRIVRILRHSFAPLFALNRHPPDDRLSRLGNLRRPAPSLFMTTILRIP